MELVYITLISSVFGLVGLLVYMRQSIINWSLKMDYQTNLMQHKIKIEQIRARKALDMAEIKSKAPVAGALGNLDLGQVGDIIDQLQGDGADGGLLSNPIVKGLAQGFLKGRQEEQPEQFQGVQFED